MAAVEHEGLNGTRGLRRAMSADEMTMQLREPETGPPVIFGHFIVWNQWTRIDSLFEGKFMELIAPGAADKTLRENRSRMRCIFQHGQDPNIGKKALGVPVTIEPDDIGVYYEVEMLTKEDGSLVSYCEDILPGLREGLYGSSCLMDVMKWSRNMRPGKSDWNPDGLEERTITEVRVIEFGPCIFQWYEGATASARSETDEYMLRKLAEDPERFKEAAKRAGITLPAAEGVAAPVTVTIGGTQMQAVSSVNASQTNWVDSGTVEAERVNRRYKRAMDRAYNATWACTVDHLAIIQMIINERLNGYTPTADELADRIGDGRESPVSVAPNAESKTAVIGIGGTLMPHGGAMGNVSQSGTSVEDLQQAFREAQADPAVDAIVLNIDSPGGEVSLIPEFGAEIKAAADAHTADPASNAKIVAIANTLAASAAYWLMSQANEAVVTPSGQVGSIGIYTTHQDLSEKFAQQGIDTTVVSAGKYKTEGNPYGPLTEEAQAEMQRRVDAWYNMFVGAVADGRNADPHDVEENYGQGRIMQAQDALDAGMVDKIATLDDVLDELAGTSVMIQDADEEPMAAAALITPTLAVTPKEPESLIGTTTQDKPTETTSGYFYGGEESEWILGQ